MADQSKEDFRPLNSGLSGCCKILLMFVKQIFEDLEYLENIKKSNHNMKRSHSGQLKQTEQEKTWE